MFWAQTAENKTQQIFTPALIIQYTSWAASSDTEPRHKSELYRVVSRKRSQTLAGADVQNYHPELFTWQHQLRWQHLAHYSYIKCNEYLRVPKVPDFPLSHQQPLAFVIWRSSNDSSRNSQDHIYYNMRACEKWHTHKKQRIWQSALQKGA